ncbi:MAG: DUF1330 domain-containing protein [Spirochaetia bacterium]|nr:DUF1330 domain-containing protein [Spirochaetia bacterium]
MAKGYWITTYHSIENENKMATYKEKAGPVLVEQGGRFIVRGEPVKVYEQGIMQRVVIIEFENIEKAILAHDSPGYQEALKLLGDGAKRDIRFVEGLF